MAWQQDDDLYSSNGHVLAAAMEVHARIINAGSNESLLPPNFKFFGSMPPPPEGCTWRINLGSQLWNAVNKTTGTNRRLLSLQLPSWLPGIFGESAPVHYTLCAVQHSVAVAYACAANSSTHICDIAIDASCLTPRCFLLFNLSRNAATAAEHVNGGLRSLPGRVGHWFNSIHGLLQPCTCCVRAWFDSIGYAFRKRAARLSMQPCVCSLPWCAGAWVADLNDGFKYVLGSGYLPTGFEVGYNHFAGRLGMSMPETAALLAANPVEYYVFHWGLGTLTHAGSAAALWRPGATDHNLCAPGGSGQLGGRYWGLKDETNSNGSGTAA